MTNAEHDAAIASARQHMFDALSEDARYHWCQKLVDAIRQKEAERAMAEERARERVYG